MLLETHIHSYNRNTHLHNYNGNSHAHNALQEMLPGWLQHTPICIISVRFVTHIFAANIVIYINAAETSNCKLQQNSHLYHCNKKIHQHKCSRKYHRQNWIELQNLHNCNRRWHLHNCYRKGQLHSSNRIFHLQNWL